MPTFPQYLTREQQQELQGVAQAIMAPNKGILACDDSIENMDDHLAEVNLPNTEENRRLYRQLIFTAGKDLASNISGMILRPETIDQKSDDGTPFAKVLEESGVITGVNLDEGLVPLGGTDGETTTQGLDGLAERASQYRKKGAKFAKWRGAYKISNHTPSLLALQENANALARYASICQQNGLVPIVEPDVSIQGEFDIETAQKVLEQALAFLYKALSDHHVYLEGTLLKPNMVTPGKSSGKRSTADEIGEATIVALRRRVPVAVPGIGFLSGGQTEEEATLNLNAISKCNKGPWRTTFCYGRAIHGTVRKIWAGKAENVKLAQAQLLKRAKINGDASMGLYTGAEA